MTAKQKKSLSAADILAVDDLNMESVAVPEWHGTVFLRPMTSTERDDYEAEALSFASDDSEAKKKFLKNFRARHVAKCLVDEDGNRLFEEDQVEALGKKSARAMQRLFDRFQKINAISAEDQKELEKN